MGAILRLGVLAVALAALPARAEADLWIELYTGQRPAQADTLLAPMRQVFEERGWVGGDALAAELATISTSGLDVPELEATRLPELVKSGYVLLASGKYADAAERLERAVELADGAQAFLARTDAHRDIVVRALLGLAIALRRDAEADDDEAKSLQRKRRRDEAKAKRASSEDKQRRSALALEEAVRFSTANEPSPDVYGTEPVMWWREARERLISVGTGTLIIDPGDAGVTSFANGGYAGQGTVQLELPPGRYRIYSHRADVLGRVHVVEVTPRKVTRLEVDWQFDAALRTGRGVWFSFGSPEQHRELRARFAARLAQARGKSKVIAVGLTTGGDGHYAYGVTFDAAGNVLASGQVHLGRDGADQRLRSLARLLTGDKGVPGVDRFDPSKAAPARWLDRPRPADMPADTDRSPRRILPIALIAAGAALVATGATLYAVDQDCTVRGPCDVPVTQPTYRNSAPVGIGLAAAGLVSTGVGAYLLLRSPTRAIPTFSLSREGGFAGLAGAF